MQYGVSRGDDLHRRIFFRTATTRTSPTSTAGVLRAWATNAGDSPVMSTCRSRLSRKTKITLAQNDAGIRAAINRHDVSWRCAVEPFDASDDVPHVFILRRRAGQGTRGDDRRHERFEIIIEPDRLARMDHQGSGHRWCRHQESGPSPRCESSAAASVLSRLPAVSRDGRRIAARAAARHSRLR